MVIKQVELETVCGITSTIPENLLPEVAFAGKSNVGKSSLINALMNRKALARTSAQPGKTQTINFYNINDFMYLVDLPGYGYAKISESEKVKWGKMIENYLHVSKQLKAVFLLIDIRHDPSENDIIMYDWILHQGFEPIIIATKADKINKSQLPKHIKMIRNGLKMRAEAPILPFSSLSKQGKEEIWAVMDLLVGYPDGIEFSQGESITEQLNHLSEKVASSQADKANLTDSAQKADGLDSAEKKRLKPRWDKDKKKKKKDSSKKKKKS